MKKNFGVLIGIVILLIVAVFVNIRINKAATIAPLPKTIEENLAMEEDGSLVHNEQEYFETFRTTRQSWREEELAYLETIILNQETDAETLKDAQTQKLAIVDSMEKEMTIESLLKAKGFADSAVTFHKGSVNVIIKATKLDDKQVAQILDIVCTETGEEAKNVKVSVAQ